MHASILLVALDAPAAQPRVDLAGSKPWPDETADEARARLAIERAGRDALQTPLDRLIEQRALVNLREHLVDGCFAVAALMPSC